MEEIARTSEEDLDESIYFDAWNFGKPKGDYEYVPVTVITEGAYVNLNG